MSDAYCWGIFREEAHSPGRESDDAEILRLTAKGLVAKGFQVDLRTPDELASARREPARGIFLMCERPAALQALGALEAAGVLLVNSPAAVLNTYRERMVAQFAEAGVPFVESRLVATSGERVAVPRPVWVKRADVHNTQEGDVVYAADAAAAGRARGPGRPRHPRAVIQPHVDGDLIKFYGIGPGGGAHGEPPWFRWFYHKDQKLRRHAFDGARSRASCARRRPRSASRSTAATASSPRGRARPDRPQRVAQLCALPRGGGLRHRGVPGGALPAGVEMSEMREPGPRSREIVERERRHAAAGMQGFALYAGLAMARGRAARWWTRTARSTSTSSRASR